MEEKKKDIIKETKELKKKTVSVEEPEFFKTLEGQILEQLGESISAKYYIEAQLLSWAFIEQFYLPRLIRLISSRVNVSLPTDMFERSNQRTINLAYYCLSHDKGLFNQLEKGRRLRNRLVHKLNKEKDMTSINKLAKEAGAHNLDTIIYIGDMLVGKIEIPSINLYRHGWNDGLKKVRKKLEKL